MTNKNKYNNYSNEELIDIYLKRQDKYHRLVESEIIAKNILKKYDIPFYYRHEEAKHNYNIFIGYLKKRNINLDAYHSSTQASLNDIILRLEENFFYETGIIDNESYKYNGYLGNNKWDKTNNTNGAEIKIYEINKLYENIIEEVTKNYYGKKLIKKAK